MNPFPPLALDLMETYARDTGITGESRPRRYLWTDAFGVCAFLGLACETGQEKYRAWALELVDQVHHVLGRHREDDERTGWISGLPEGEGADHPTRGGLRIGKALPERKESEPFNERLEWERDGQYFHYLTRWMHALFRVWEETGEERYLKWGKELAATAHGAFTLEPSHGPKRMVWKKSIDLSRTLVPSSGQHDPLDGLISYLELAVASGMDGPGPELAPIIGEAEEMCRNIRIATVDPLGIGGLLVDAGRLVRVSFDSEVDPDELLTGSSRSLLESILAESSTSLAHFSRTFSSETPATQRLAFRELGLSIGLNAVEQARFHLQEETYLRDAADTLLEFMPLAEEIEGFWSRKESRDVDPWKGHQDINAVMLATSLAPGGYLGLDRAPREGD